MHPDRLQLVPVLMLLALGLGVVVLARPAPRRARAEDCARAPSPSTLAPGVFQPSLTPEARHDKPTRGRRPHRSLPPRRRRRAPPGHRPHARPHDGGGGRGADDPLLPAGRRPRRRLPGHRMVRRDGVGGGFGPLGSHPRGRLDLRFRRRLGLRLLDSRGEPVQVRKPPESGPVGAGTPRDHGRLGRHRSDLQRGDLLPAAHRLGLHGIAVRGQRGGSGGRRVALVRRARRGGERSLLRRRRPRLRERLADLPGKDVHPDLGRPRDLRLRFRERHRGRVRFLVRPGGHHRERLRGRPGTRELYRRHLRKRLAGPRSRDDSPEQPRSLHAPVLHGIRRQLLG